MYTYVILLNWNGWKDTIECLESVFRLACPDFGVVVCDNASTDGSLEKIKEWARGELLAKSANPQLSHLTSPPFSKPIPYLELPRWQTESRTDAQSSPLTLIHNDANLGFAAGNNVGLRYALSDPSCRYIWLLNTTRSRKPHALSAMVRLMQQRPEIGLCGSLNLSYHNPTEVQAQGGNTYRPWMARARTPPPLTVQKLCSLPAPMDYINGASMLASRTFLETVGLMEESYFLYFEELDWAMRAKGMFDLGYARQSVIYHKVGATIGSNLDRKKRSLTADKYLSRNRILFTRRFFPTMLPSVLAWTCLAAAHRLCLGDLEHAKTMFSFMLQGLKFPISKTE